MDSKNILTWASYAAVGDKIVYHIDDGRRLHSNAMALTFQSAWNASCRGLVFLCQKRVWRNEGDRLQYMAIRISPRTAWALRLIERAEYEALLVQMEAA